MPGLQTIPVTTAFVPMPVHVAHRDNIRRRFIRRGKRIFGGSVQLNGAYLVAKGEVMIIRDGCIVDFVEEDELLDSRIWRDATAVAYTDCLLTPQDHAE